MGVVIRRWVWLETIGVISGCFPHKTYISLLHLYLVFFAAVYIYISGCTSCYKCFKCFYVYLNIRPM